MTTRTMPRKNLVHQRRSNRPFGTKWHYVEQTPD
jgi:hypothetical protein